MTNGDKFDALTVTAAVGLLILAGVLVASELIAMLMEWAAKVGL